jgi:NAD(P)-dependent dehydrogenase (short-subunit alcohol dehydrogenase family)
MHDLFSIKQKVALVTGASSGLGRHFALTLARAGAMVVIAARRAEQLQELAKEIESFGGTALVVSLDITKPDMIQNIMTEAIARFGRIDILVNTAGNVIRKPILEFTGEDFDSIINTHLKGCWLLSMAVAKEMIKQNKPLNIINVSTMAANKAYKNGTLYSTAKAGVSQLTRSLAYDLVSYNIRVNAIAPGLVITDLNKDAVDRPEFKAMIQRIPMARTGEFRDFEGPLLFLASDASRYITGCILPVDGGHACNPL